MISLIDLFVYKRFILNCVAVFILFSHCEPKAWQSILCGLLHSTKSDFSLVRNDGIMHCHCETKSKQSIFLNCAFLNNKAVFSEGAQSDPLFAYLRIVNTRGWSHLVICMDCLPKADFTLCAVGKSRFINKFRNDNALFRHYERSEVIHTK